MNENYFLALDLVQRDFSDKAELLSKAYSFIKRYRTSGSDAKMSEAERCGLTEARSFLDSATAGLFDNRYNTFYVASFFLDHVRPQDSAGILDILLTKSSDALHMLLSGEKPDSAALADTEALLSDVIHKLTEEPPAYAENR